MNGKNGRTNVHIDFYEGLAQVMRISTCSVVLTRCNGLHSSRCSSRLWSQSCTGDSWTMLDYIGLFLQLCFGIFLDSSLKDVALHCPFAKEISRCVASELMACGGP